MKVRFAPSPTGYLHIGNIRTALVNWLYARKVGGHFLLRIDDTDEERSRPEYEQAIREDMEWLGLMWDSSFRQSERYGLYASARQKLVEAGRLYPCYETAEELEIRRKMQLSRGAPPLYDRAALKLTEEQKKQYEAEGRKPHWRFLLKEEPIVWDDQIRGETRFEGGHLSDPVLVRENGVPTYTFSSVVDDGEEAVTHVIRGEDHVSNTAVQIQLWQALGYAVPTFAHLALIRTAEGELSKRTGGGDIRSLREAGFEPMAIVSLLAKLGTSDAIQPCAELKTLAQEFDINKFSRAPATYDPEELERLNHKLLGMQPYGAVQARLGALLGEAPGEAFWQSVRGNIQKLSDAKEWWEICHGKSIRPVIEDGDFAQAASALLPGGTWSEATWDEWVSAVKQATGRKGKALFMPLRKALTGRESGPELKVLLPMMGREKVMARLSGKEG